MSYFNIVAATSENTVVTEYEPVKARSNNYQSEAELEKEAVRAMKFAVEAEKVHAESL